MIYRDPYPQFSFLPKMIASIYKNLGFEYNYTKLKLAVYNFTNDLAESDYFNKSLVDCFWYLHNHRNESDFDKRICKACDLFVELTDKEKDEVIRMYQENFGEGLYNIRNVCKYISDIYLANNNMVKIISMVVAHILIYNTFSVYFVLPPDFFTNCAISLCNREISELSVYLHNRILSQKKQNDLDIESISRFVSNFMNDNKFNFIQSISLFGSIIDGSFNTQSDLDLLLVIDDSPSYVEVNSFCSKLKHCLKKKYNYNVDFVYDTDISEFSITSKKIWSATHEN